jgi:hypothetical protein
MDAVDTFEHAGLHVRIVWEEHIDENDNPRSFDGNMGVMFCDYRGYTLGDIDAPDPRDQKVDCEKCEGTGLSDKWEVRDQIYALVEDGFASCESAERYIERNQPDNGADWHAEEMNCTACEGDGEVELSIVEYLVREHGAKVVLPLFVYEHSGITMSCGANLVTSEDNLRSTGRFVGDDAGWDTSTVGVIYDTTETHKERGDGEDLTVEQIVECLTSEVAYYAAYLEGSVFGYEVIQAEPDEDGDVDLDSGEVLDGCWGFLELNVHSDDAYIRQEAKASAEYQAEKIVRERELATEAACRDIMTVP